MKFNFGILSDILNKGIVKIFSRIRGSSDDFVIIFNSGVKRFFY